MGSCFRAALAQSCPLHTSSPIALCRKVRRPCFKALWYNWSVPLPRACHVQFHNSLYSTFWMASGSLTSNWNKQCSHVLIIQHVKSLWANHFLFLQCCKRSELMPMNGNSKVVSWAKGGFHKIPKKVEKKITNRSSVALYRNWPPPQHLVPIWYSCNNTQKTRINCFVLMGEFSRHRTLQSLFLRFLWNLIWFRSLISFLSSSSL